MNDKPGCLTVAFIAYLILIVISEILSLIGTDALMILILVGAALFIIYIIISSRNEKEQAAAEAEQSREKYYRKKAEQKESTPYTPHVSRKLYYNDEEEKYITEKYSQKLERDNIIRTCENHIEYLNERTEAFKYLGRDCEALTADMRTTEEKLKREKSKDDIFFTTPATEKFYSEADVKTAFDIFAAAIPSETLPDEDSFFNAECTRILYAENRFTAHIFTPCYVIFLHRALKEITRIDYKKIKVTVTVKNEPVNDERGLSYKTVGTVAITTEKGKSEITFNNRKDAEECKKSFTAYKKFVEDKNKQCRK